jgi:hypothetical protein
MYINFMLSNLTFILQTNIFYLYVQHLSIEHYFFLLYIIYYSTFISNCSTFNIFYYLLCTI